MTQETSVKENDTSDCKRHVIFLSKKVISASADVQKN